MPGPSAPFEDTRLATGQHLLDASMFWGPAGGVRRVLSTKHALMRELGWRHTTLAPGVQGPDTIDCGGWPLPGSGGYRLVLGRQRVARLMEHAEPDLIEVADPYTLAWSALDAAERLRVPAVATCHGHLPSFAARIVGGAAGTATRRGQWAAARARAYLVDLYERFDLVLAPSVGVARELRHWGLPRVMVQPLGVDCAVFHPAMANPVWRVRLCLRLGLSPTTRLLVYSGRFAPEKNLQLLADAVQRLGAGHALLAVGEGPTPPRGPRVHLMKPIGDSRRLARLVASADAYVHAGDRETFGLGMLEAMACGTPVVAAGRGALAELGADAAILVPDRHPETWAEAMRAALAGDRGALTAQGLLRAQEHDWSRVLQQFSTRYLALLRRHAALRARAPQGTVAHAARPG